jgi:hypothetical protein
MFLCPPYRGAAAVLAATAPCPIQPNEEYQYTTCTCCLRYTQDVHQACGNPCSCHTLMDMAFHALVRHGPGASPLHPHWATSQADTAQSPRQLDVPPYASFFHLITKLWKVWKPSGCSHYVLEGGHIQEASPTMEQFCACSPVYLQEDVAAAIWQPTDCNSLWAAVGPQPLIGLVAHFQCLLHEPDEQHKQHRLHRLQQQHPPGPRPAASTAKMLKAVHIR